MTTRGLSILLICSFLVGCTAFPVKRELRNGVDHFIVPDEFNSALVTAKPCCRSYAEFNYKKIDFGTTIDLLIDTDAPAFLFDTGKSYFVAFRLPEVRQPYRLIVRSYFSGHAFWPSIIVLDEKFQVTRFVTYPTFRYLPSSWTLRGRIEGTIEFNTKNDSEKYIVILTTDKMRQHTTYESESGYAYSTGVGAVFVPGGRYARHYGPVGQLEVKTEPISESK